MLQHFRTDEHPFIKRAEDWIHRVGRRHQTYLTDFLNPRERYILTTLVRRSTDVTAYFDGGYEEAEYERCLLAPDYWSYDVHEMGLTFIKMTSAMKGQVLTHRDYLGALLSLGIKRETFGDLILADGACQCVTTKEIGNFICTTLQRVHRTRVMVEEIRRDELIINERKLEETHLSVASLRLDAVLSAASFRSRSQVASLIRAGKCKLNWKVVDDSATPVEPGDTLSLRGWGRLYILRVDGKTRRGRIRLIVGKPSES